MRRVVFGCAFAVAMIGADASAEIYKYKKANGTVVYTDNLAQLPPERREHYNRIKAEQDAKRAEAEMKLGREEIERREAEAKKAELEKAAIEERERAERMRLIDLQLAAMSKKRQEREASRDVWRKRMSEARDLMNRKLAEFKEKSERADSIAIKPSFSLLPGEAEELEKLKKELETLEREVDAAIDQVDNVIPEQARLAGIPPGYLR